MAKEDLAKTRVERANLRQTVTDSVSKVRQDIVDLGGALQSVVESSSRSSEDVADKLKDDMEQAWKRMLTSLGVKYASVVSKVLANVVQQNAEVQRNVERCAALISACLDEVDVALPADGESASVDVELGNAAAVPELGTGDHEGPPIE